MDIVINKPILNRKTPEENIALLDQWVSDTADKLNLQIQISNRRIEELENKIKE